MGTAIIGTNAIDAIHIAPSALRVIGETLVLGSVEISN